MDHSEVSQAVPGLEDCDIIEVIDHHRLGDIESMFPIDILAKPVGSTSTLVAKRYQEHAIIPPADVAAVMLSSIISDTLLFRSPTTTSLDHSMSEWLAELAQLNVNDFGMQVLAKNDLFVRFIDNRMTIDELISHDFKIFSLKEVRFGVGQVETVDLSPAADFSKVILDGLDKVQEKDLCFVILVLTNVLTQVSYLFCSMINREYVQDAFGDFEYPYLVLDKIVSRKLQIVPPLMEAIRCKQQL